MNIKSNAAIVLTITAAAAVIGSLIVSAFSYFSIVASATVVLFAIGEMAILYFMKRVVLHRKQNIFALISIALIGATFLVAMIDIRFGVYKLPAWCTWLGIILFFSGNYLMITSLIAQPRHCKEEYGEEPKADKQVLSIHGAYDVIRHPLNLAGFLLAFSIPLILSSAWAFIAAGLAAIFIIVHAVTIENYRFENYKWYYDYTKKVPFMMIPVLW